MMVAAVTIANIIPLNPDLTYLPRHHSGRSY